MTKQKEIVLVYLFVSAVVCFLSLLSNIGWAAEIVPVAIAFVFLWVSIRMVQRQGEGAHRFGLSLGGLLFASQKSKSENVHQALKEVGIAIAIASVVFPCFAIGFWFWFEPTRSFSITFSSDIATYFFSQLVVVALPEEAFFRGYLQTRLTDVLPPNRKVFGVHLSVSAWILQAALFALMHFLVTWDVTRLAVFFPGLLFGLIRAWRKGIGAALLLHALSNLFSYLLFEGWVF